MIAKKRGQGWMNQTFVVMVILGALIMLIVGGCGWPKPPKHLSPPDGSVFNHYPRTTTLEWEPLSGAVKYRVEVDCFHCCQSGKWCTDVGQEWDVDIVTGTSHTFNFVGAQPGRWRVSGINAAGEEGQRSNWWYFEYTV